jgi:hypothetical protein
VVTNPPDGLLVFMTFGSCSTLFHPPFQLGFLHNGRGDLWRVDRGADRFCKNKRMDKTMDVAGMTRI